MDQLALDVVFNRPLAAEVREKLITHAGDPVTSKRAARRVVKAGLAESSRFRFNLLLEENRQAGLTCKEAGRIAAEYWPFRTADAWYVEFDKRVRTWERINREICTERNAAGEATEIRDGCIVWRKP